MSSVNKVILVGHLGKDPEVRYINEDTAVANFTMATSETYKDKTGQKQEKTEWHNIVVWRGLAQVAEKYLKKGKLIYVEGKLRNRSYDDKDGIKRYITEIVADNFTMLGSREGGDTQGNKYSANSEASSSPGSSPAAPTSKAPAKEESFESDGDNDLPF
ncbi:MAG: single-strand DNA-binding protein [Sphingobacteriales bacterium]|jgi:single-strand DNA-binding protein